CLTSDIESSVESLDHPVDNAPVRSLVHKNLTVEGYSRAAVQTYWRVPELKLGFDLGAQPWAFMATPNWFVSHAHLDHIAALPRAFQRLDRGRMPAQLIGLTPGQEVELSRELVVRTFATRHTVPSLGFL